MPPIDRNPALIEKIRADPNSYLGPGRTTDFRDIALELVSDALYLGAKDASVHRHGAWTIVASTTDRILKGSKWALEEAFFRIEFIQSYRQNASRATVLVPCFAEDVVTYASGEPTVIQGNPGHCLELTALIQQLFPIHRVVAFQRPR